MSRSSNLPLTIAIILAGFVLVLQQSKLDIIALQKSAPALCVLLHWWPLLFIGAGLISLLPQRTAQLTYRKSVSEEARNGSRS